LVEVPSQFWQFTEKLHCLQIDVLYVVDALLSQSC